MVIELLGSSSRTFVTSLVLMGTALLLADCTTTQETDTPPGSRPNIVVIVTDDAGYIDFGAYGGAQIPTPHIDSIARNGVRFTQGYVTASVCAPSRAGLLTGRYQQRFGHEFNGPNDPVPGYSLDDMGLDPSEVTVAEALREEGYRTMAVGKWHMGTQERFHPSRHGFDEFFGMLSGGRSYFPIKTEKIAAGRALLRNRDVVPEQEVTYTTDMFSDEAVSFIRRTKEQPFFLYLAYNAVHTPMHAKEEDLAAFPEIEDELRRIYAAMTRSLDEGVGRVLDALDQEGLADDTLLFFINDNGGATNNGSNNGPLRGMKGSKWEGGIRVPFMVRWPGKVPAGMTFDRPVSSLDILATSVNAAQGSLKGDSNLDGVNLLPFLDGRVVGDPHEMLFWRRGVAAAVRAGDWKLIRSESNPTLLFDLAQDLGETENLAPQHPGLVNELLAALEAWERDLAPPKWTEGEKWERNQIMKHRLEVSGRAMEREYP